jgi:hypothetical protein
MVCRTIIAGPDFQGIVCSRGERRKSCKFCRGDADKQCDFKLRGSKAGKTCDANLCSKCAVTQGTHGVGAHSGDSIDYCPPHARAPKQMELAR